MSSVLSSSVAPYAQWNKERQFDGFHIFQQRHVSEENIDTQKNFVNRNKISTFAHGKTIMKHDATKLLIACNHAILQHKKTLRRHQESYRNSVVYVVDNRQHSGICIPIGGNIDTVGFGGGGQQPYHHPDNICHLQAHQQYYRGGGADAHQRRDFRADEIVGRKK
jgi:hypothetical protein